jgi:hypothetical protein
VSKKRLNEPGGLNTDNRIHDAYEQKISKWSCTCVENLLDCVMPFPISNYPDNIVFIVCFIIMFVNIMSQVGLVGALVLVDLGPEM